jgi:hypothetical protein
MCDTSVIVLWLGFVKDLGGLFYVGEFSGNYGVCVHFGGRSKVMVLFRTSDRIPPGRFSASNENCIALDGISNLISHLVSALSN